MEKIIDFDASVFDTIQLFPEVKKIMLDLGFADLNNPAMLNTVGRFMTINKGIRLKKMNAETVRALFVQNGFTIKE